MALTFSQPMNNIPEKIYYIDFETNPQNQCVTEFAYACFNTQGKLIDYKEIFYNTKDGFRNSWETIDKNLSQQIIAAHNIGFDRKCLLNTFPLFQAYAYLDTLAICRKAFGKNITDYSLTSLIKLFNLNEPVEQAQLSKHYSAHHALYDSYACGILLNYLMKTYQPIKQNVYNQISIQNHTL